MRLSSRIRPAGLAVRGRLVPASVPASGLLVALCIGHIGLDLYSGALPLLFPPLIARFDLSLAEVGLMTFAFFVTGSLSQPIFGWLGDRFGYRLAGLGIAWTAASFGAIGFAPSFPVALLASASAGLGSGAFHPLGALAIGTMEPERQRTSRMALFISVGTVGNAIGPIAAAAALAALATRGTALLMAPGLLVGAALLVRLRDAIPTRAARPQPLRTSTPWRLTTIVVVLMMARAWIEMVFVTYTPAWYSQLGYDPAFYAPLTTVLLVSNVLGILAVGALAARFGRRRIVLATLVATVPAVLLFAAFPGPLGFLTAAMVGFVGASTGPVLILAGQQAMASRAGLASGLVFGIGAIVGAVGIPVTGVIADRVGLGTALALQVVVAIVAIPVAMRLPDAAPVPGTLALAPER